MAEIGRQHIDARPEYYVQTGSAYENPYGIPRDEIERFIANNPPEVVAQVIFGKFVDNSGLVFTAELINNLFDRSYPRVLDEVWLDKERWRQGRIDQEKWDDPYRYAIGVDLARRKDHTVISVLDTGEYPARLVYWRRTNRVPWPTIYAEIGRALWMFPGELLLDETGTGGDVVKEELESRAYCPIHHITFQRGTPCTRPATGRAQGRPCKQGDWIGFNPDGFTFTKDSKTQLLNHLQSCLGRGYDAEQPTAPFGAIKAPPIETLAEELTAYTWDDKKLQTDAIFSLALAAWQGLEQEVDQIILESAHGR